MASKDSQPMRQSSEPIKASSADTLGSSEAKSLSVSEAETTLFKLASIFLPSDPATQDFQTTATSKQASINNISAEGPDSVPRYKTLVEQIPAVIFMAFLDKGISEAYVSPQIEAMLGFTQEEWLNDPVRWFQHIHPDDKNRWSVEAAQLFLSGEPLKSVYRVIARDKKVVWFHIEAKMVRRDDGRPWFIHGVAFDVTELKLAEEALRNAHDELEARVRQRTAELAKANQELKIEIAERKRIEREREASLSREQAARAAAETANRAKDEFLATASHELRTPLNAILGWARILRFSKLDQDTFLKAAETIERNAKAQARLVEDLLDVSRIITGKLRLDVRPVDLAQLIAAALDSVRPAADAKGIRLEAEFEPQAVPMSGDRHRLQQIVWNLLSNAVKFTQQGGSVVISLHQNDSQIVITVTDTGTGINPDFLPHVFDRFRQADGTPTRPHGGLGLGLAIVRHLTELHGGTVQAFSSGEGQGAKFTVCFPATSTGSQPTADIEQKKHQRV